MQPRYISGGNVSCPQCLRACRVIYSKNTGEEVSRQQKWAALIQAFVCVSHYLLMSESNQTIFCKNNYLSVTNALFLRVAITFFISNLAVDINSK